MRSVLSGSMAPHLSGRMSIRIGSIGLGKSLLMPPFMPWQRQMGAPLMTDLRPSQHVAGGVTTVMLVR